MKSKNGLCTFALALLWLSGELAATGEAATPPDMWVAPYHPCYQWDEVPASHVPWNSITHLILGYLWPEKSGSTWTLALPPGWSRGWASWQTTAQGYIAAGHTAGRKVTCMLGGAQSNPGNIWNNATSTAQVDSFAVHVKALLQPIGFDGVDLDWEDAVDYPSLVRLAQKLRYVWPDAVITIPTDCQGGDAASLAPAKDAVDAFMPMTYLDIQQWGGWRIPIPLTPLYGAPRPGYGPNPYSVDYALSNWISAGVPASKIVMGVGGFGSVWGDTDTNGRAPIAPYSNTDLWGGAEGETYSLADDNVVTWNWVKEITAGNPDMVEGWDDIGKCSYWHAPATDDLVSATIWGRTEHVSLIFYETPRSMSEKLAYCTQKGMKGMMFWTLSEMMDGTSCPILDSLSAGSVPTDAGRLIPAGQLPLAVALVRNFPNPFNPSTTVSYILPRAADVRMEIYDVLGRKVRELERGKESAGEHRIRWNGEDSQGLPVSGGVYFCRLTAGPSIVTTVRMVKLP